MASAPRRPARRARTRAAAATRSTRARSRWKARWCSSRTSRDSSSRAGTRSAGWRARGTFRSATTRTRPRPRALSRWWAACATRSLAITLACWPMARSSFSAAARCRSTRAARRSTPRRWSRSSAATPRSTTRSWSARPTTASASASRRSCSRAPVRSRARRSWSPSPRSTSPATSSPRRPCWWTRWCAARAASPTTAGRARGRWRREDGRRGRTFPTLRRLPLPGRQVEVVAPGGDLVVADLEHTGARQLDAFLAETEAIDALGEDEVAARREVEDLGLDLVRGEEEVQDLADAVLPGHRVERHVVVDRVVGEILEEPLHVPLGPTSEKLSDDRLVVPPGRRHPERPPATRFAAFATTPSLVTLRNCWPAC